MVVLVSLVRLPSIEAATSLEGPSPGATVGGCGAAGGGSPDDPARDRSAMSRSRFLNATAATPANAARPALRLPPSPVREAVVVPPGRGNIRTTRSSACRGPAVDFGTGRCP